MTVETQVKRKVHLAFNTILIDKSDYLELSKNKTNL